MSYEGHTGGYLSSRPCCVTCCEELGLAEGRTLGDPGTEADIVGSSLNWKLAPAENLENLRAT